jgi:hypothetical protein
MASSETFALNIGTEALLFLFAHFGPLLFGKLPT